MKQGEKTRPKRMAKVARLLAAESHDRITHTGCVITDSFTGMIISTGVNRMPDRVNTERPERHEKPGKYLWMAHAEESAIVGAARLGIALEGTTMYLPWYPCAPCARMIKGAGIAKLWCIAPTQENTDPQWVEDFKAAGAILCEGGVEVWYMEE